MTERPSRKQPISLTHARIQRRVLLTFEQADFAEVNVEIGEEFQDMSEQEWFFHIGAQATHEIDSSLIWKEENKSDA